MRRVVRVVHEKIPSTAGIDRNIMSLGEREFIEREYTILMRSNNF